MNGNSQDKHDTLEEHQVVVRSNYELFIVGLLILQLFNSILAVSLGDSQVERIPVQIGFGIALYLMADAFSRLVRSPDRRRFMSEYHGYLVLLGSLPIPFACLLWLWWYRLVIQKLRRADFEDMGGVVVHKRAQSALLAVILAAVVVLEVSSILIVKAEQYAPGALIVTADDAIWWSLVTMATVGYGDMYPVTASGRFVAVFVMFIGVSLFTVLTSYLSQNYMRPRNTVGDLSLDMDKPVDAETSLDAIKQLLDQYERDQKDSVDELRSKLDELDRLIAQDADGKNGSK